QRKRSLFEFFVARGISYHLLRTISERKIGITRCRVEQNGLLPAEPVSPGTVRTLARQRETVAAHRLDLHGDVESVRACINLVLGQRAVGIREGAGDGLTGAVDTEHRGVLGIVDGDGSLAGSQKSRHFLVAHIETVLAVVDECDVEAEAGGSQREEEHQAAHLEK
ncbi:hypothetical protein PENTCL1PPCAC_15185, partial [Pristionchus entomophagus]